MISVRSKSVVQPVWRFNQPAFTLIELLVAITIMLIVFSMTAGVVSLAINTDRIPSSARTIQAGLMGARDRALRAGASVTDPTQSPRRGIRFVPNSNPNLSGAISSLVYIGTQDDYLGSQANPSDNQLDFTSATSFTTPAYWASELAGQNLTNCRIKIPNSGTGSWYRLLSSDPLSSTLTRPFPISNGSFTYRLQLPSIVLPNEQPLPLDGNVVINLARSLVPGNWNGEILFTPEGKVYGPLSAQGPIYFYLSSMDDFLASTTGSSLPGRDPADPAIGETLIIKINTQNGRIQTFPVDPTDTTNDMVINADNPFRIAQQQ